MNGCDYEKFHLPAEVTPIERLERIKTISKRLEKRHKTILISTQVVEAGVDFDFDVVVRDIAPIDSIRSEIPEKIRYLLSYPVRPGDHTS